MANSLNVNVKEKWVVLTESGRDRLFYCREGFGCNPSNMGYAIFGEYANGMGARISGAELDRLATPEEVAKAEKGD